MNPTRRIVLKSYHKVILFLVFLLLTTMALLPLLINPLAAALINKQAAEIFGDKLIIDGVKVTFWTGTAIHLNGVELAQPPRYQAGAGARANAPSLFKADAIRMRVNLRSLLNNQLVIHNISVFNPRLHLIQARNGAWNTDYYLAKLNAEQPQNPARQEQSFAMQRLTAQNGRMTLASYQPDGSQLILRLTACDLTMNDLEFPNRSRVASPFHFTGLLGTGHQARVRLDGKGVFGTAALSFAVKSRIEGLFLPDYNSLAPGSAVSVTDGSATVVSDSRCNDNYLRSDHHVTVAGFKIKPKRGRLDGLLVGAPASLFAKAIADRNGTFDFDFSVTGRLDDLKANMKFKIVTAIQKAIRSKLGLDQISTGIRNSLQKVENTLSKAFGRLFRKKK